MCKAAKLLMYIIATIEWILLNILYFPFSLSQHQAMKRHNEAWRDSLRYRRPDLDRMTGIRRITINNNPMLGDQGAALLAEVLKDDLWLKGKGKQLWNLLSPFALCYSMKLLSPLKWVSRQVTDIIITLVGLWVRERSLKLVISLASSEVGKCVTGTRLLVFDSEWVCYKSHGNSRLKTAILAFIEFITSDSQGEISYSWLIFSFTNLAVWVFRLSVWGY